LEITPVTSYQLAVISYPYGDTSLVVTEKKIEKDSGILVGIEEIESLGSMEGTTASNNRSGSISRSYDERARLLGGGRRSTPQFPASYTSIGDLTPRRGPGSSHSSLNIRPTMNRKLSRIRTNSVSILNADGDDVVSTSFGPVIIADVGESNRDWMLGWFLAIISGVLFTANNFFVKYLNLDALEILLVRSTLQSLVVLIGIVSTKTPLLPASTKDRVLVILQGALSGVRVFLQFACLSFMPLGDALTLVFTEPLWTIILSKIILKINIGWWKMVFGIILVGGMVLTIQPPFLFHSGGDIANNTDGTTTPAYITTAEFATTLLPENSSLYTTERSLYTTSKGPMNNSFLFAQPSQLPQQDDRLQDHPVLSKFLKITGVDHMRESYEARRKDDGESEGEQPTYEFYYIGAILALSTAVSGSLANVIIAKCESVSSSVMVFYSGLGGVVLALVCSSMDGNNRIVFDIASIPYDEWLILIMLGGSGLLGYYSMTRSLQLIPPTTVAVLRALEIILAYIAQACIMGEIPNPIAITGSSLVMICVIAFALEETIMSCYYCF